MDAFEENLFYQLASVCTEARQTFIQLLGMSQARYRLLALLAEEGEIRHASLQQTLLLDGATITRLVKQFESEGLVSRRLDPQDNRYTLASLTDAGRQVVAGISKVHHEFVARLLEGISSEEQAVTLRVLEHLRATLRLVQEETQEQT